MEHCCNTYGFCMVLNTWLFLTSLHLLFGTGKIPPESTLIFNVDLLEIRNGPRSHESFQEMDLNDDWKLSKQEVSRLRFI